MSRCLVFLLPLAFVGCAHGDRAENRRERCAKLPMFEVDAPPKKKYDVLTVVRSEVAASSAGAVDSLRLTACDLHADAVINVVVEKVEGDQSSASGVAVTFTSAR